VKFADERVMGRRYVYEDRTVFAVDLGHVDDATVDVVDGTVIVVTPTEQHEFEVPEGSSVRAAVNNGVLTIELEGVDETTDAEVDA
jgi:hypothetical protein